MRLNMARHLILWVLLVASTGAAYAQPSDAAPDDAATAVRATVDALFDAMRAADSAAVRRVFAPDARLQTVVAPDTTEDRPASVRTTPVARFATAVGQPRAQVWDERIWDVVVQVDGPLATAWTPYAFYLGTELHHCGVNAIQLVRLTDGWRIQQLTDTRHPKASCRIPARVANG